MAYWREIERSRGALIHELHRYWTGKLNGRQMPTRTDIDPGEIKRLLPNLVLTDLTTEPFRVRYRLLGTRVVVESGSDFTGRYLDEMVAADIEDQWETCYRLVWAERRPIYGDTTVPTVGGETFSYEFGMFPLGTEETGVTQCVAVEDYGALNDKLFELQDKAHHWQPKGMTRKDRDGKG
jgi:hypothetical protein